MSYTYICVRACMCVRARVCVCGAPSKARNFNVVYIMDQRLAALKTVSFYLLHNVSTLNQCRKFFCVTVVCKYFASYKDYPNYKWDLIR
jgi:hypothetical protein